MLRVFSEISAAEPTDFQRGMRLTALGVFWVLAAQIWPLPAASAIVLVGWGTTQVVASGRMRHLALPNGMVYCLLGGLAMAAQGDAALRSAAGEIGMPLAADLTVAADADRAARLALGTDGDGRFVRGERNAEANVKNSLPPECPTDCHPLWLPPVYCAIL